MVTRTEFFNIAYECGYIPGEPVNDEVKAAIRARLHEYFSTPEGMAALGSAPRQLMPDGRQTEMTADMAIEALMEELI